MLITAKSYFSGAGGMDLGIQEAGVRIIESFEIDKKCCETLRSNFNQKEGLIPRSLLRNKLFQDMEEEIY